MPHTQKEKPSEQSSLIHRKYESTGVLSSIPARWVLALWSFLGFVNIFTLRTDINIAILAMVNDTNSTGGQQGALQDEPLGREKFSWSESQQSLILSAFYYGYCSTQILGGYLSQIVGAKLVMGHGLLVTSVLALLTPLATVQSYYLLVACRVGQGLAQGLVQPCMHHMWSKWAPETEKSKLLAITFSGSQLGTVIVSWASGIVCQQGVLGGWSFVFYLFGGMGVLWSVGWLSIVHESPAVHPRISVAERTYIEESSGRHLQGIMDKQDKQDRTKDASPPLGVIVRSPAFLAIVFAHFANDWGCFALTTCLPSFLHNILKYDLEENGALSALPFLILMVTNPLSGYLADQLRSKGILSTKNTRKLNNSIGLFVPAGLMLAVCLCERDRTVIVTLLTLAVGFSGFTMAGYSVNHLDIAPSYAGILYAITNTIGTTSGFIGPAIVGLLTSEQNTITQWNIFFYLSASIFFLGGLIFLLFAEGEPQAWDSTSKTTTEGTPSPPEVLSSIRTEHQKRSPLFTVDSTAGVGNIQGTESDDFVRIERVEDDEPCGSKLDLDSSANEASSDRVSRASKDS